MNQTDLTANDYISSNEKARRKSAKIRAQKEKAFAGTRRGKLVIVEPLVRTNYHLGGWWLCHCDCGNTHEVMYSEFKRGKVTSCGCMKELRIDRTGMRFGRLTVTSKWRKIPRPSRNGNSHRTQWLCQCDCGNRTWVRACDLGRYTNSCGCLRKNKARVQQNECSGSAKKLPMTVTGGDDGDHKTNCR